MGAGASEATGGRGTGGGNIKCCIAGWYGRGAGTAQMKQAQQKQRDNAGKSRIEPELRECGETLKKRKNQWPLVGIELIAIGFEVITIQFNWIYHKLLQEDVEIQWAMKWCCGATSHILSPKENTKQQWTYTEQSGQQGTLMGAPSARE